MDDVSAGALPFGSGEGAGRRCPAGSTLLLPLLLEELLPFRLDDGGRGHLVLTLGCRGHDLARVGSGELVRELLQLLPTSHLTRQPLEGQLAAVCIEDHPAQLEDDEVVTHQVGVVRVVGDEDDPQPRVPHLEDVLQHDTGLLDTQRGRRLVEDDDVGAEVDGPGDGDDLALTTGQCGHRPVEVGDDDPHLGQLLAGHPLHLVDVETEPLAYLVAEEEVAPHRHQRREGEVLVHRGDAGLLGDTGGGEGGLLPVQLHDALGVLVQAGHDLDEGRLTGTVVAEDTGDLALADRDVDTSKRVDVAIALPDVVQLEDRHGGLRGDLSGLGHCCHDDSAFRFTAWLTSTAPMSRMPRKVLSQSTSHPAYVMPRLVMP